jgi:hypothetical protein
MDWAMAFEQRAQSDGYGDQMSYRRGNSHESKVVNEFLKSHAEASHLFLAMQVLPLVNTVDFDINHQITSLSRHLGATRYRLDTHMLVDLYGPKIPETIEGNLVPLHAYPAASDLVPEEPYFTHDTFDNFTHEPHVNFTHETPTRVYILLRLN